MMHKVGIVLREIVYRQLFPKIKVQTKKMYTYICGCERTIKSEIEDDRIECNVCHSDFIRKVKV
jgi:DNA-directed RNA polymerase subunit RPC12/RpoP